MIRIIPMLGFLLFFVILIISGTKYVFAAPGNVFYSEDFMMIKEGDLPANWVGGEKLMVKDYRGRKYVTNFEKTSYNSLHSIVINNVRFPQNYKLEFFITIPSHTTSALPTEQIDDYVVNCVIGNVRASLKRYARGVTYDEIQLNNTIQNWEVMFYESRWGKTMKLTIQRERQIVRFLINDQVVAMGRYPESTNQITTFSLCMSNGVLLHSLKGTEL